METIRDKTIRAIRSSLTLPVVCMSDRVGETKRRRTTTNKATATVKKSFFTRTLTSSRVSHRAHVFAAFRAATATRLA
jgi:hypothetical protein